MNLRDTTCDLIAQVEQQTSFMVEVVPDPVLATMSTVIMAGHRTVPAHVIRYNPTYEHILDYLVCFQCGIVLSFFANPPEARVEIASVPGGAEELQRLLAVRPAASGRSRQELTRIAQQVYGGVVTHLRSVPV